MPYITDDRRGRLNHAIHELELILRHTDFNEGDINYVITKLLLDLFEVRADQNPRYSKINMIMGVLECVKQELYRRHAGPYEDIKIEENGDV